MKNCDQYDKNFTFNAMQCIDVNVLNDVVILAQTSGRVWWCIVRASDGRTNLLKSRIDEFFSKMVKFLFRITSMFIKSFFRIIPMLPFATFAFLTFTGLTTSSRFSVCVFIQQRFFFSLCGIMDSNQ